jgi:hypothetical protein
MRSYEKVRRPPFITTKAQRVLFRRVLATIAEQGFEFCDVTRVHRRHHLDKLGMSGLNKPSEAPPRVLIVRPLPSGAVGIFPYHDPDLYKTLIAGLSVHRSLRDCCQLQAQLKQFPKRNGWLGYVSQRDRKRIRELYKLNYDFYNTETYAGAVSILTRK